MAKASESRAEPAAAIEAIASRLDRLSISRIDPEAFFEERSELAHLLRKEAGKLRLQERRSVPLDTGKR